MRQHGASRNFGRASHPMAEAGIRSDIGRTTLAFEPCQIIQVPQARLLSPSTCYNVPGYYGLSVVLSFVCIGFRGHAILAGNM